MTANGRTLVKIAARVLISAKKGAVQKVCLGLVFQVVMVAGVSTSEAVGRALVLTVSVKMLTRI